jgi:hypothetical protein
VAVDTPLRELARSDALRSSPWHAGQVACALGEATPAPLWRACVRDVEREPRAPWTALASARRAAWPVFERAATALAAQVREHGPHRGGVGAPAPELALTAITAEALAPANIEPLIRARRLAQDFLACRQVIGDTLPESSAPARLHGGFPLTPVHAFQRSDVTAHAVLAMWADAPHASSRQELRHALGVPFDGRR